MEAGEHGGAISGEVASALELFGNGVTYPVGDIPVGGEVAGVCFGHEYFFDCLLEGDAYCYTFFGPDGVDLFHVR